MPPARSAGASLPGDKVTLARQVLEGYSSQGKNDSVITMERVRAPVCILAGFILGKETFIGATDRVLIRRVHNGGHSTTMIVGLLEPEEVWHKLPLARMALVAQGKQAPVCGS